MLATAVATNDPSVVRFALGLALSGLAIGVVQWGRLRNANDKSVRYQIMAGVVLAFLASLYPLEVIL